MRNFKKALFAPLLLAGFVSMAQRPAAQELKNPIVEAIVKEANDNSQLEKLAHELMDGIGPRLVGTPEMQQAGVWALGKYKDWGIAARNEKWGEWKGWQRGVSHIDMTYPRAKSLEGMQLAWSPGTNGKTVNAEVIVLPYMEDSIAFAKWLPAAKGKIVLTSMNQPTGRPDYNWEEFGTKESVEKMKKDRDMLTAAWAKRISNTGYNSRTLPAALEKAGAVAVVTSNWSRGFGVNKIFGAYTKNIPSVDIALEDYGLLYRLAEAGGKPRMSLKIDSKNLPPADAFNIVAEMKGTEKPNEYVMLSAHFDSWDGGTGATDNGTGTIVMMEAMRILKKVYPNPKRTI
ncbi:MAG: M28 family peptidase, partial [Chitinophagaceae bacterium]